MFQDLPDSLILQILGYLSPTEVACAGQCCTTFRRIAHDEILWRNLFHRKFRVQPTFQDPIGHSTWREEFIRLVDETPIVEAQVLTKHSDQVLHVSFSHDGQRFTTTAKDGYVHVWNTSVHPIEQPEFSKNMKKFSWKYTQFSQFNESDTLLLVSGVLFGLHSTSGEIAIFSLKDDFRLECRAMSKPYDIFGTWYSDMFFLSGNLHWLGNMVSKTEIWLNKASQESESEHTAIMNKMFRFYNPKASSVRSIIVANCVELESPSEESSSVSRTLNPKVEDTADHSDNSDVRAGNPPSSLPLERDLIRINSRGVRGTLQGAFQNWKPLDNVADIDYTLEYHISAHKDTQITKNPKSPTKRRVPSVSDLCDQGIDEPQPCSSKQLLAETNMLSFSTNVNEDVENEGESLETVSDECGLSVKKQKTEQSIDGQCSSKEISASSSPLLGTPSTPENYDEVLDLREKLLIFTCGSETYTPHQIGFKRIHPLKFKGRIDPGPSLKERMEQYKRKKQLEADGFQEEQVDWSNFSNVADRFDQIDCVLDLHGHVIGMTLSPDHRYLYVNSRPWPGGYEISNPLEPPPIAQEIDIHVIDLTTLRQVGTMRRAHRAYTPNEECFFIFLDACDLYLASGAEDKHGYLWDRHYGISLMKLPHQDVVNSVAFNPADSQMLVSVSDDHTIKVWRSKSQCRSLGLDYNQMNQGTKLYMKSRSQLTAATSL